MPATLRSDRPELLTLREAAAALRVSTKTITIYMKKGVLRAYKVPIGNKLLFKRADIEHLIAPVGE
jgi:excisionase family DNA binding protein